MEKKIPKTIPKKKKKKLAGLLYRLLIFITGNVVYVMDFILYLCIISKCFDQGRNILWQHMHDICA